MAYSDADKKRLREQYESDGYVVFRNAIDASLAREASRHVDWLMEQNPGTKPEDLHTELVRDDPFWLRLVSDSRLVDIAEIFVGPDVALFASHYICKPPKTGRPVLWHQDGSFWPLEPMKVVTLWLAVTDSRPDNGCMRILPGTHTLDLAGLREQRGVDSVLGSEMDADIDDSNAVDLTLEPGDVSVHNPNIVHGSEANTSDRWRKGLTIRYIPTSTKITKEGIGSPFLLRGKAVDGINSYLDFPVYNRDRHFAFTGAE